MGQIEHRNVLKIELCNFPHFSLQNWGHAPTLTAEKLVALAYVCIHLKHPFSIIHYSHLSFMHKKTNFMVANATQRHIIFCKMSLRFEMISEICPYVPTRRGKEPKVPMRRDMSLQLATLSSMPNSRQFRKSIFYLKNSSKFLMLV